MKVPLIRERVRDSSTGLRTVQCLKALPFFRSSSGKYIHRVRGVLMFYQRDTGHLSHSAVHYWCGGSGFPRNRSLLFSGRLEYENASFFDSPPEGSFVCATCEGRAIGAGMAGAREIAGKPVMFQPRI